MIKWIDKVIERITHRHAMEAAILELQSQVENVGDIEALEHRLSVLEKNIEEYVREASQEERFIVLEKDRTELFTRVDEMQRKMMRVENCEDLRNRVAVLEDNRTDLYERIDSIKYNLCETGIINLKSKLAPRILRLEILWYYRDLESRKNLDEEQLALLEYLENDYEYGRNEGRTWPEDSYYTEALEDESLPFEMGQDDGIWYADIDGTKLYLGENKRDTVSYLKETLFYLEGDTPHRYLNPEQDGIDIPEGCILLDIGAAEGFFGIRHLKKCKKVYFFECDEKWLKYLRKTCEPLGDKVEIIKGFVGDQEDHIRLDDFFKNREKPTCIKMDVEGAEGAVLRGAKELLESNDPMTLLLCTYHREEDWNRYSELLQDKFTLSSSNGYYWNMEDPYPPFFRKGIMRAVKKCDL